MKSPSIHPPAVTSPLRPMPITAILLRSVGLGSLVAGVASRRVLDPDSRPLPGHANGSRMQHRLRRGRRNQPGLAELLTRRHFTSSSRKVGQPKRAVLQCAARR